MVDAPLCCRLPPVSEAPIRSMAHHDHETGREGAGVAFKAEARALEAPLHALKGLG